MPDIDWNTIHASGKEYAAMPDAVLDAVLEKAGSPRTVADLACGSGDLLVKLAQRGLTVTGVDVSSVALERARAALESKSLAATLVEADLDAPGFAAKTGGPYDAVFMRLALAFIRDRDAFLEEAKTLLTSGGAFICSTPVLLDGGTYDARQQNISIQKQKLEELLARHFKQVELVVPDELARPEWPLATYVCR